MRKIFEKEWKWVVCGLLILGLSFYLRVYQLTILPVFADEAIYIRWSQIMANEPTLRFLPLSDGKQPLFMWVLMFLVRRFNDPLFIGRFVSVLAGMGTVVGIFVLSFLLFRSKKVSLVSSFIWAISPFAIFFERMALVDSMLAFWIVWVLIFGILTVRYKRFDLAMVNGFILGCASLTKSPAIFSALLLPTVVLVSRFPKKKREWGKHIIFSSVLFIPTYLIAFGMYNIQRLGPNFQMLSMRTKDYVFPISHLWENPKDPFIPHFDRAFEWIEMMGPGIVLPLVLVGVFVLGRKRLREILLLLIWFFVPLIIQAMFAKTFTARYVFYTLPPLFALSGIWMARKERVIRSGSFLILAILIVQAVGFDFWLLTDPQRANLPRSERSGYLEEWTAGTGIREVAQFLKEEALREPKKQIVVGTEGYFGTLPDGLWMYVDGVPGITVIGVGLGIKEIPISLYESAKAGNKTYLLANTSRLAFEDDPKNLGLFLVKSYQKAKRPEGLREYVIHGERDELQLYEVRLDTL